LANLTVYKA